MTSFEDTANALGQLVVQVSANAVRSNELAKSTKESYDTAMNYIQELRKAHKDQQELIEDLQKRLEEQPEEPSAKRLRTEAPWTRPRRDPARSEYAESPGRGHRVGSFAIDVTSIAEALPRIVRWRSPTWR